MRLGVRYDNVKERIGALLNLVPVPVGYSMFGMPIAPATQGAQRTGVFRELAARPAGAEGLARRLGLREEGPRLVLDSLCAAGLLRRRSRRYALPPRVAKWLDPASETY